MAAKIITIFNQKGGCGKTMTTMQLAAEISLRGLNVIVVDMDRQNTSTMWSSVNGEHPFPATVVSLAVQEKAMVGEVAKLAGVYDVILIDCPPAIESEVPWHALNISDLALIPITPVMDNIWASRIACQLACEAKKKNPDLSTYILVSMMRRGRLFESCIKQLKGNPDIPVLNTQITMRNAYPESQLFGTCVQEHQKNSPAAKEINDLADEVMGIIGIKGK